MATNVERLREAGLLRGTLPKPYADRINAMSAQAVAEFIKLRDDLDAIEKSSTVGGKHYHDFMNVPF